MFLKLVCVIVLLNACSIQFHECSPRNDPHISINLSQGTSIEELIAVQEQSRKMLDDVLRKLNNDNSGTPRNCVEATATSKRSGIYDILVPKYSSESLKVYCDAETQNGGWTVFLRRMDGSIDFHRNWNDYKNGFGELDREFFMGLDKLYAMTSERHQQLLVLLEDYEGNVKYELYDRFAIANENDGYRLLSLGIPSGSAGDSLSTHLGLKFTTYDRDNDNREYRNCAEMYLGAWWYKACHSSHLTGMYGNNNFGEGINWKAFRGFEYSLKRAVMMIKPAN